MRAGVYQILRTIWLKTLSFLNLHIKDNTQAHKRSHAHNDNHNGNGIFVVVQAIKPNAHNKYKLINVLALYVDSLFFASPLSRMRYLDYSGADNGWFFFLNPMLCFKVEVRDFIKSKVVILVTIKTCWFTTTSKIRQNYCFFFLIKNDEAKLICAVQKFSYLTNYVKKKMHLISHWNKPNYKISSSTPKMKNFNKKCAMQQRNI